MKNPILSPLIALRLYVSINALLGYLIIALEKQSIVHKVLLKTVDGGYILISLGLLMSSVAILDTLVNDIMSDRYTISRTKRLRHVGFMFMSLMAAFEAYFILKNLGPSVIVFRYVFDSIVAASVAFIGLKELLVFPQCDRRQPRV